MRVDVNAFLGEYPWPPARTGGLEGLRAALDRTGTAEAWVSHLGALVVDDPGPCNEELYAAARADRRIRPVPSVHPGLPGWVSTLDAARANGAPAVRADPGYQGLDPAGPAMQALTAACSERAIPLLLAVRLADIRQRHPDDRAPELSPADLRALVRSDPKVQLIVTHADRDCIEQVHFGSTPEEAARILWDICWIWGPPEDHLELLLATIGVERFTFGSGMPLRLPEAALAKLDLLELDGGSRKRIERGNLDAFLTGGDFARIHSKQP